MCLNLAICTPQAFAADAPGWMHMVASAPLPAHDDKTEAVLLYSQVGVTVVSDSKVKTLVREAYRILRPDGRRFGVIRIPFNSHQKINGLRGWCIPAQGKDYEVKDKEAVETALFQISNSELINDVKDKVIQIPAADPGNVVGYEYELEEQPYVLQDSWYFQHGVPVREAQFTLQLPPGWEYKATFLNAPEVKPVQIAGQWQWSVSDIKALKGEDDMPPWAGVAGHMIVSYFPSGNAGTVRSFSDWRQMGLWYQDLTRGRADSSPDTRQKATSLTAGEATTLEKMRSLAQFVQKDIRYVAIELGIGGWQPHFSQEVLTNRYGDCKDKATLLSALLREVGIDSYYVVINTERGSVTPDVPPSLGAFDHAILAIKLPAGMADSSLYATFQHPKLGTLLFFDPTNEITPFGQVGGYLQANYGLLVSPDGGELVLLPKQPGSMNGIHRVGKLSLSPQGVLTGDFDEKRIGDRAAAQRAALRSTSSDADKIKPIETLLSHSLSTFRITKASVGNFLDTREPFEYHYSVIAQDYAKNAGGLLLVRPRVLGTKSSSVLETREPRTFPYEFEGPLLDSDTFEISLPAGYVVDDLPPAVDLNYSFGNYHSRTEARGNVLRYSRTLEVKELSVPVAKIDELRNFYRRIAADERSTAVLKPAGQ